MARRKWLAMAAAVVLAALATEMKGVCASTEARSIGGQPTWYRQSQGEALRSSGEGAPAQEQAGYLEDLATSVLAEQNRLREALGLQTLAYNENLCAGAKIRAKELCRGDYLEHERPDGSEWHMVLRQDVPTTFVEAGENLASVVYGNDVLGIGLTPEYWVTQWENSPRHAEIMTAPSYDQAGVAVYAERKNGVTKLYAVTLYAQLE